MKYEILEALVEFYKEEQDVLVDCLLWLKDNVEDDNMSLAVDKVLTENHLCIQCGGKMEYTEYKEIHEELEFDNIETLGMEICSVCGYGRDYM